jgi:hypothetical protein
MRIFILLNKEQDDYSSLPKDVTKIFVFDRMGNPTPEAAKSAIEKMEVMFDTARPDDRVIFNGPSWLIALAGYMWMSHLDRKTTQILAYDNFKKQYVEINNEY